MSTEEHAADGSKTEVVASIAYVNGRRDREVPIDEVAQYVSQDHGMLWIGLRNPRPEVLAKVASELGACDKNQEEMLETHRRPKIIDYGNMILIVAITVEVEAERPIFGETQFLIGDGFLVSETEVTFWQRFEDGNAENCPEFEEYSSYGFGASIAREQVLDIATGRITATGEERCSATQ